MMGGRCDGGALVFQTFEEQLWGTCRGCMMLEEIDGEMKCQVVEGRDTTMRCPALQDHVGYHEIKLYGVNKP